MYVFGGWVPVVNAEDRSGAVGTEWICTNSVCELDLGQYLRRCHQNTHVPTHIHTHTHTQALPLSGTCAHTHKHTKYLSLSPSLSDTLQWQALSPERQQEEGKARGPRARAGHCTATIGSRLYVWSGRDGYRKNWNYQVCCKDLWYLETGEHVALNGPMWP